MVKIISAGAFAAVLILAGCHSSTDQEKLAEAQQQFQQTVASVTHDLDEKLLDAEMKNHQLKQGDKAACRWLKKSHPAANEGRSWKEACTALYNIKF